MVEKASLSPVLEGFVKTFSKERKSLLMKRGSNKAGKFLEVVTFVDEDRKGIIWIPEARIGRG